MRNPGIFWLALALCTFPALHAAGEPERIELIPAEKADWTPRNLGAGISSLVLGPSYWYKDREVLVETIPAGADLALYYIRSNFQKRYERAVAPVRVVLPRRIHATSHDVMTVRAASAGYLSAERRFKVFDLPEKVIIQLSPLPNSLVFLGQTHLAGRTTLTLRTTEEPELRVSRPRGSDSFTLALTQTADKLDGRPVISSGYVRDLSVAQIGEDLLVRVTTAEPDLQLRSKAHYDPVRKEHVYVLDVTREGDRPPSYAEVREEIGRVGFREGDRCHELFEDVLRERLDRQILARAFRPSGSIAESYQREAMLRLGRLREGRVESLTGELFRTGSQIGVALALQSAGTVRGYLALLGAIARTHAEPAAFLRALVAPDMGADAFASIYTAAEQAWGNCATESS